jgi:hypothetical protein
MPKSDNISILFKEGQRRVEWYQFYREFKDQIDDQIPKMEQLTLDLLTTIFGFGDSKKSEVLLQKLEPNTVKGKHVVELLKDIIIYSLVNGISTEERLSGYNAQDKTRAFPYTMLFASKLISTGIDDLDRLAEYLNKLGNVNDISRITRKNPFLTTIITSDGGIFWKDSDRIADELSGEGPISLLDVDSQIQVSPPSHESESLFTDQIDISILVGWDLENALPVFIAINALSGPGLDNFNVNLHIEAIDDSKNLTPFPLIDKDVTKHTITKTTDTLNLDCLHSNDRSKYRTTRKFKLLLPNFLVNGRLVNIWVTKEDWNTFETLDEV